MSEEFEIDILEVLVKHKMVPENQLRNSKIKSEYYRLRAEGIKGTEAAKILARNFNTSIKNIHFVLYSKNKKYSAY
ncbi:MAG: hypothetical protein ACM3O3_11115 [Syntrophothermus sp.]|nr:hypothetical protein [Ignavibacteriaceae bacterium]